MARTCWTWVHFEHVRVNVGRLEFVGAEESQVGFAETRHGEIDGSAVLADFEGRVRDEEADRQSNLCRKSCWAGRGTVGRTVFRHDDLCANDKDEQTGAEKRTADHFFFLELCLEQICC